MARKLYSIKYEEVSNFIKNNKTKIDEYLLSTSFEYAKLFGNAIYEMKIKNFIEQFKIDKDKVYALEVVSFFKSSSYIEKILSHIGTLSPTDKKSKDLFYVLVYVLEHSKSEDIKEILFFRSFLFYVFSIKKSSNINIDHKRMSLSLLKTSYTNIVVKESFSENTECAFFTIKLSNGYKITENGNSIKTLRKKVYKRLFFDILDNKINSV